MQRSRGGCVQRLASRSAQEGLSGPQLRIDGELLQKLSQRIRGLHGELDRDRSAAHRAVGALLVPVGKGINAILAIVHHVVVHIGGDRGDHLDGLIRTSGRNNGISRRDSRYNILGDALRKTIRHALDAKLVCAILRLLIQPRGMVGGIHIQLSVAKRLELIPEHDMGILDAMLRETRGVGNGAQGEVPRGREQTEGALEAARKGREYDAGLALEALRAAVDERDDGVLQRGTGLVVFDETEEHGVEPAAGVDGVQTCDDEVELLVEALVEVHDVCVIRDDIDARDAGVDKVCGDGGFGLAYVGGAEEELAVEVCEVDCVEVDEMDVPEAGEGEVFEQLAAQTTGADY